MGSQLIANILPSVNKDQRTLLYDAIKRHVVTLRGSKTGSRTVWLLCVHDFVPFAYILAELSQ